MMNDGARAQWNRCSVPQPKVEYPVLVSIITPIFNNRAYIRDCIESIIGQLGVNIEYIIIDGGSQDGSLEIIREYGAAVSKLISEPDDGIYDAMNKGIRHASGEIVGILNSDDMYAGPHVIQKVVATFTRYGVEACYGDLVYVRRNDPAKVVRKWKSADVRRERFKYGWVPAHPTFFARKTTYDAYGLYETNLALAADYELMLRFLYRHGIAAKHIPEVLVKMRSGGKSHPGLSTVQAMYEIYRSWRINNLKVNPLFLLAKPLSKIGQYVK